MENANKLVKCLTEFGFGSETLTPELFTAKDSLVIIGVEPLAVDFLNYLTGVEFEAAYTNRNVIDDDGFEVSVIGLEDLIKNKIATGRHKDLADVEYLTRIKQGC